MGGCNCPSSIFFNCFCHSPADLGQVVTVGSEVLCGCGGGKFSRSWRSAHSSACFFLFWIMLETIDATTNKMKMTSCSMAHYATGVVEGPCPCGVAMLSRMEVSAGIFFIR